MHIEKEAYTRSWTILRFGWLRLGATSHNLHSRLPFLPDQPPLAFRSVESRSLPTVTGKKKSTGEREDIRSRNKKAQPTFVHALLLSTKFARIKKNRSRSTVSLFFCCSLLPGCVLVFWSNETKVEQVLCSVSYSPARLRVVAGERHPSRFAVALIRRRVLKGFTRDATFDDEFMS